MVNNSEEWTTITPSRIAKGIEISVTQDHFKRGVIDPFDWKTDPFAIAIRETLKVFFAQVGWGYATTYDNNIRVDYYIKPIDQLRLSMIAWRQGRAIPVTFTMYKEKEKDVTPTFSSRKPARKKNFTDLQIEAQKKQARMEL